MIRAIQVGLGGWGRSWARDVVPKVPGVTAVGYVDAAPAALAKAQRQLGIAKAQCFTSLKAAAAAVEADLVIAPVRTAAHAEVVSEALALGLHVLVEKPFARTVKEAKTLVARAERAGRVLAVSQNYRHYEAPQAVAGLLKAGRLGRPGLVSLDFRRYAPGDNYPFFEIPDPLLADMSIHHFDLMRMVLGAEPVRVACRSFNPPKSPFAHDPTGAALIEFEGGTLVSYRGSWMSAGEPTPWAGEWAMDFSGAQLQWTSRNTDRKRLTPDRLAIKRPGKALERPKLQTVKHRDRRGALNMIRVAIETGREPAWFSSGRDNLKSLAICEAAIASAAKGGNWIEIADILG